MNYEHDFSPQSAHCLNRRVQRRGDCAFGRGGYADVWQGILDGQTPVALKFVVGHDLSEERLRRRVWREYATWRELEHRNILPCLGFCTDLQSTYGPRLCFVSLWMDNGTVMQYVRSHPDVDRAEIIDGVAQGLRFLHDKLEPIVHGDLRGDNILIDPEGNPRIMDFGLSKIPNPIVLREMVTSDRPTGAIRWMAPELFLSPTDGLPHPGPTVQSDIWSFGMTILEILTGAYPYAEYPEPWGSAQALAKIVDGTPPARPPDAIVSARLWDLCLRACWRADPAARAPLAYIARALRTEPGRQFSLDSELAPSLRRPQPAGRHSLDSEWTHETPRTLRRPQPVSRFSLDSEAPSLPAPPASPGSPTADWPSQYSGFACAADLLPARSRDPDARAPSAFRKAGHVVRATLRFLVA